MDRPESLDERIAVVVFTVPARRLREFATATGPCMPLPGKQKQLRNPLAQDLGETRELTASLYTVLTGADATEALVELERDGDGVLSTCSRSFLEAMASRSRLDLELAREDEARGDRDLSSFAAARDELDRAWLAAAPWPKSVVSTRNRLGRTADARQAVELGQGLYCWHGPSTLAQRTA